MKANVFLVAGVVLLLTGVLGFLASAVALASVDEVTGVKTSEGTTLTLKPDDPRVAERKGQAETVLFGSLVCGGGGVFLIGTGVWMKRRTRYRPADRPVASEPER